MADKPDDLPDFADPPVVEVVLGVQFDAIRQLRQAHFGLLWEAIREQYPRTFDRGRLETPIEQLAPRQSEPSFQIEMLDPPPTHRTWFISEDDEKLVQLQDDRLIHNWRHRGGQYPRFELLRNRFQDVFSSLESVLKDADLPPPVPRQVEVTYINWIEGVAPPAYLRSAGESAIDVLEVGPSPEVEQWLARYPVRVDGSLVGRLTIESKPTARRKDSGVSHGYQLSLTYLGPIELDERTATVEEQLERGRNAVVRSFAAVTREDIQQRWGRIQ